MIARSTPAIALRGFSAGYGDRAVLHSISCAIPRNRTTALVGPGGSGKSTLLQAVQKPGWPGAYGSSRLPSPRRVVRQRAFPLLPSAAGETLEQEIWRAGGLWRTPGRTSYLPQRSLPGPQSLGSLLARWYPGAPGTGDARHHLRRFWRAVAAPAWEALEDALDTPFQLLPRALRRLAEFTVVASSTAPLLLIDEPELGMGEEESTWIAARLAALSRRRTILLVTHNLALARQTSETMIFLLDGVIIESGDTARLFSRPRHPRTRDLITYGS